MSCTGGVSEVPGLERAAFSGVAIPGERAVARLSESLPNVLRCVARLLWLPSTQPRATLRQLLESPPQPPEACESFRVISVPKSLEERLVGAIESRWPGVRGSKGGFSHCLHVAVDSDGDDAPVRFAWVPRPWCWLQSPDAGPTHPGSVASAIHKLDEALLIVTQRLWGTTAARIKNAVDIGAAPGAWTSLLAKRVVDGGIVIAVDPAELSHTVGSLPCVRHIRRVANPEAVSEARSLLSGSPVDIITCDANVHPSELIEALKFFVPLMRRPGGALILTLKFRGVGRDRSTAFDKISTELVQVGLERPICVWLMANTNHERTLISFFK